MPKKVFCLSSLLLPLIFCNYVYAQQVTSTSGATYSNAQGSLSVTVGEPVVQTISTINLILTQGFQQSNPSSIVPLQLISFTGSIIKGSVTLQWTVLNEIDILSYTVERSLNAIDFEPVNILSAKNNTSNTSIYGTNDFVGENNTVYYRLSIKEKNGNNFYSWIVRFTQNNESIKVYPVPVVNQLNIELTVTEAIQKQLTIIDASGKIVFTKTTSFIKGKNVISLQVGHLPTGTYFLQGLDNKNIQLIKE